MHTWRVQNVSTTKAFTRTLCIATDEGKMFCTLESLRVHSCASMFNNNFSESMSTARMSFVLLRVLPAGGV